MVSFACVARCLVLILSLTGLIPVFVAHETCAHQAHQYVSTSMYLWCLVHRARVSVRISTYHMSSNRLYILRAKCQLPGHFSAIFCEYWRFELEPSPKKPFWSRIANFEDKSASDDRNLEIISIWNSAEIPLPNYFRLSKAWGSLQGYRASFGPFHDFAQQFRTFRMFIWRRFDRFSRSRSLPLAKLSYFHIHSWVLNWARGRKPFLARLDACTSTRRNT